MPLLDYFLQFADNLAVDAAAGTEYSATTVDLTTAGVNPNGSKKLYLVIEVTAAFTSAGAAVVQFGLTSDAVTPNTTGHTVHWLSEAFDFDDARLGLGQRIIVPLPTGSPAYERYMGLKIVTSAATTTAGSINAYLSLDPPEWKAYPEGAS